MARGIAGRVLKRDVSYLEPLVDEQELPWVKIVARMCLAARLDDDIQIRSRSNRAFLSSFERTSS